ncbi:MAG: hypothetical protein M3008_01500 [Chloroflexota bacterium]|nr:hypothetical protein [Chloroflexota bacterium]
MADQSERVTHSTTPAMGIPSCAALGLRALALLALAVFFPAVLVRNWSDNAYIFFPLVGIALLLLSVPFAIAALLPAGRTRRVVASVGIALVRVIGGFCCVVLMLSVIPAATQYYTRTVLISHLAGLALLLPVVLGIGWRVRR